MPRKRPVMIIDKTAMKRRKRKPKKRSPFSRVAPVVGKGIGGGSVFKPRGRGRKII